MYAYLYVYMYTDVHVYVYMFVYMDMCMCVMNVCMGLYVYMDMNCYEDICGHCFPSSAQPGSFFTNISLHHCLLSYTYCNFSLTIVPQANYKSNCKSKISIIC